MKKKTLEPKTKKKMSEKKKIRNSSTPLSYGVENEKTKK